MIHTQWKFAEEEICRRVSAIMQETQAVGLAVSILEGGNKPRRMFFGWRDREEKKEINADSIFGLASITKSFTALSILQLCEKGNLSLQAPVSLYLPQWRDPPNRSPVRLWHLLCHSGGFFPLSRLTIPDMAGELGIYEDGKRELAYNNLLSQMGTQRVCDRLNRQTQFTGEPGTVMSYCNDGFGLLSEIVHRAGDCDSYAGYVKKHLLAPLHMDRSGCEFVSPLLDENHNTLYQVEADGTCTGGHSFYENAFVLHGGGAMRSTLRDMENYVRFYLRRGRTEEGISLLGETWLKEMETPRVRYRFGASYGFALSRSEQGPTVLGHGGSLVGISSYFAYMPEENRAVIVLCNTTGVPVSAIGEGILRLCRGERWEDPRRKLATLPWGSFPVQQAVGRYVGGEGQNLELQPNGNGGLRFLADGRVIPSRPVSPDTLLLEGKNSVSDVMLEREADGRIFALRYGGRMIPREP